jgi:hypothetical protein
MTVAAKSHEHVSSARRTPVTLSSFDLGRDGSIYEVEAILR